MRRARFLNSMAAIVALSVSGCGYHTAGHFSTMPKNVRVIAVPAMENKTSTYRVEQKLTAATIHELLAKTHYRVVSDANGGDAVLTGNDDKLAPEHTRSRNDRKKSRTANY